MPHINEAELLVELRKQQVLERIVFNGGFPGGCFSIAILLRGFRLYFRQGRVEGVMAGRGRCI